MTTKTIDSSTSFPLRSATYGHGAPAVASHQGSYGNKYDNLRKLAECVKAHKGEEAFSNVIVPPPFGLSTEEVEGYLKSVQSDFFIHWEALKKRSQQPDYLATAEDEEIIQSIKEALLKAFTMEGPKPWDQKIQSQLHPQTYYMVRSSGAEDGKTANAGGNLSLNYVLPEGINEAMAKVIGSYFDVRSLRNQSELHLHLSVAIQELIGEAMGGEANLSHIPISCVLFSNEPLYTYKDDFRIMRLSASFGHGEGVVGNQGVGTDTLLLLESRKHPGELYVLYDHQSKPQRLAPREGKLTLVDNPEELIEKKPIIDSAMAKQLFHIAKTVEKELPQEEAADFELVIKNGTIYLVQVRPINRDLTRVPSYVANPTSCQTIHLTQVLVPGHAQALTISSSDEILFADTLEAAQFHFKPEEHKCVVVRQEEPANSHPTIQFSERGVPCFYHPEELQIDGAATISPQQALIAQGEVSIQEGFTESPARIRHTVTGLPYAPLAPELRQELNRIVTDLKVQEVRGQALAQMQARVKDFEAKVEETYGFKAPAHALLDLVRKTLDELCMSFAEGPALEQLFYIKAMHTFSLSVCALSQVLDQVNAYEKEGHHALSEECAIPTLTEEWRSAWEAYLHEVERTSPDEIEKLRRFLHALGDVKPLWLTFFFDPNKSVSEHLAQMDESAYAFLEELKGQSIRFFKKEAFLHAFKKSPRLVKMIALQYLQQAVDKHDKSMKALYLSNQSLETKIMQFKALLEPYMALAQCIAEECVGEGGFHFPNNGTLRDYFSFLNVQTQKILNNTNDSALRPSPSFSVAAAALGSGTLFQRHISAEELTSLEDLFTLAHQNLLACLGFLMKENVPNLDTSTSLPSLAISCMNSIQRIRNARLIGIEQNNETLVLSYNIPQRNHSTTCQLIVEKGRVHFAVQMLGQPNVRVPHSAAYLQLLHRSGIFSFEKVNCGRNVLDFRSVIYSLEDMKCLIRYINNIHQYYLYHIPSLVDLHVREDLDIKKLISYFHSINSPSSREEVTLQLEICEKLMQRGGFQSNGIVLPLLQFENIDVRIRALTIMFRDQEYTRGRDKIIETACSLLHSKDMDVRLRIVKQIELLLMCGSVQACELVQEIISSIAFSKDRWVQKKMIDFLTKLIDRDHIPAYEKAMEVASQYLQFGETADRAYELYQALVDKHYAPPLQGSEESTQ